MGRRFLAVDPSIESVGWALYDDVDMELIEAGHFVTQRGTHAQRLMQIGEAIYLLTLEHGPDYVVIEEPMIYPEYPGQRKKNIDPNDIIKLALATGAVFGAVVAGVLQAAGEMHIESVTYLPREWKGQMPKDVMNNRVQRHLDRGGIEVPCLKRLNKRQRGDVLDAIGIGLYHMHGKVK